jgi:uroporphyrinogen III methyltransferase / synthase
MPESRVCLVGAGPGHPGLITLRAVECLRMADLVLYDRLVPSLLLEYAPPSAERVCVTELAEHHVERQAPVVDLLLDAARAGKRVVRLKGGDPLIFGRGGEEAEALRRAGIGFEIVPGVTAALGAAAFAGIPLTHRLHASAVAFVTGHEQPDKEGALDWSALARFPGTLVIYMGLSRLDKTVQALVAHGKAGDTPAAAVQLATTGSQRAVESRLDKLAEAVRAAGLTSPAVMIIGDVVRLREQLAWFEQSPLFGKRVLVTRPRRQAGELVRRLVDLGAVPHVLPAVEIRPPAAWEPVDRALAQLPRYDWLVFTSANGVDAFLGRLLESGRDLRALSSIKLAAIGPKTADALREYHLKPDLVPARYQSEDLSRALASEVKGKRVLLARADRGRELLRDELSAVADVEQIAVYSQVDAVDAEPAILEAMRRGEIDFVLLTSSNIARAFVRRLDASCRQQIDVGRTRLVSISPVTSAEIGSLGLPLAAEASAATQESLVESLVALAQNAN